MTDSRLTAIRDLVQEDVGNRGLRADPAVNLVSLTLPDFEAACRSIAETPNAVVAVVTGFFIPHATPPAGETDGPLGALFLARALTPLGIRVLLATDDFCIPALEAGLEACDLTETVPLVPLPPPAESGNAETYRCRFHQAAAFGLPSPPLQGRGGGGEGGSGPSAWADPGCSKDRLKPGLQQSPRSGEPGRTGTPGQLTHLIALERVGPGRNERCHTMKGLDITDRMSPAHWLFAPEPGVTTIGVGDGGNEIGMGKVPLDVLHRNIPGGELVGCRVATDHLIVCGISNWGAYALATGVRLLRGAPSNAELYDAERERALLRLMVERGPLVDGVTLVRSDSVDGLNFDRYAAPLPRLALLAGPTGP